MEIKTKDGEWTTKDAESFSEGGNHPFYDYRSTDYQDFIRQILRRLDAERERSRVLASFVEEKLPRLVPDNLAEEEITLIIRKKRKEGGMKINVLDLMEQTRFPPEQILRIMKKLEGRGVKEVLE